MKNFPWGSAFYFAGTINFGIALAFQSGEAKTQSLLIAIFFIAAAIYVKPR
jgi:hypothetical protein